MKGISRRTILAGSVAAAISTASAWYLSSRQVFYKREVTLVLEQYLQPLTLPPTVLEAFWQDLQGTSLTARDFAGRFALPKSSVFIRSIKHFIGKHESYEQNNVEWLTRIFVLSSNLLTDDSVLRGETPVSYVRLWSENLPCNNPYAQFA